MKPLRACIPETFFGTWQIVMQRDGVMLTNSVDLIQSENIGNIEYDRFKL